MFRFVRSTVVASPVLFAGVVLAQFPQPQPPLPPIPVVGQPQPAAPDGVEVLARGPVHEAFAETAELPKPGAIVPKAPPDPVEELPPDQKPPGDDVQWIPGYWQWDDERTDFIWISGFWRQPPPGRVWVPGTWRQAPGGFQWVQGFWNAVAPQQPQQLAQPAQIEYLPPPPAPIDVAPSIPAPTLTSFYTPGVWYWRANRYVWRPGFWAEIRPNWIWVPAHYHWSPAGYVFIDGYWDRPLATRGLLFAPVAFRPAVLVRPRFVYTPSFVISDTSLYGSLFVRRGYGSYYFGDYYEPRYVKAGYSAWCSVSLKVGNFAVSVGRPAPVYDPLWSYYSVAYRHEPKWQAHVHDLYVGRYNGDLVRPARTVVVKDLRPGGGGQVMVTRLSDYKPAKPLVVVAQTDRVREQRAAQEIRKVSVERHKLETGIVDRGRTVVKVTDTPQRVKIDLPKQTTERAAGGFNPARHAPPEVSRPGERSSKQFEPLHGHAPGLDPKMPTRRGPQPKGKDRDRKN